ncbi:MAG: hypothetical protein PHS79_00375 [Patescibacteria group bacterium]|nr:hypothetical protein [Patescibacteria group bacterium]
METYSGFTSGDLRAANWWVRNKLKIKFWSRTILIALNVLVWGYVFWGLLDAYAISYPRESRITAEIANDQKILDAIQQDRPRNIGTSQVSVFTSTEDRLDMMVDLQNPNDEWWVKFNYRFNVSGEETPTRQGFILPSSNNTLTELGWKPKAKGGTSARLIIENIQWHRVNPDAVDNNYNDFIRKHFGAVTVEHVRYDFAAPTQGQSIARTSFDVVNSGAYGYWSIDYVVKIKRGTTVIAVNRINIRELKPGETRPIEIYWPSTAAGISNTEVVPVINLLDPNAYLPSERL